MPQLLFILTIIGLILFALLLVLPTLLLPNKLKEKGAYDKEQQDNILAGRERMKALQESVAAGEFTQQEADDYKLEIEKTLLGDINVDTKKSQKNEANLKADWGITLVTVLSLVFITPIFYITVGSPSAIEPPTTKQNNNDAQATLEASMKKIEERLQQDPNDIEALLWMGKLQMLTGQHQKAADYFKRALVVDDSTADIYAAYADALMLNTASENNAEIEKILEKGLDINPSHPILLWLAGIHAETNGDVETAIGYWEKAHANMADTPENQQEIAIIIADAKHQLQMQKSTTDFDTNTNATAITDNTDSSSNTNNSKSDVVVIVKSDKKSHTATNGVLFVFAKAIDTNAPAIPLAVSRQTFNGNADGFPITVVLNDDLAMVPSIKMSDFAEYKIIARLSKTGNAKASSGDIEGLVNNAIAGSRITVYMDNIIP